MVGLLAYYWQFFPFIFHHSSAKQGCQVVCLQTKNSDLGKFWRVLEWKMLPFGIPYIRPFLYFMARWYF
jgi:hypothetical protein